MCDYSKSEFAKMLFNNRTAQNKTQYDCAAACGVSVESYRKWERGVSAPVGEHYKDVCQFLKIGEHTGEHKYEQ